MASLSKIAIAFSALRSLAKTGFLSYVKPIKISPSRFFKSSKPEVMHKIAITSEAGVILKPSSRGTPFAVPPSPIVMFLKDLSFISMTLFQKTVLGSRFKFLVI